MEKGKYIKEVNKRLGKRLKKSYFEDVGWVGLLVIWIISSLIIYRISPLELYSVLVGLVPAVVTLIYILLNWRFKIIPTEIFKEQEEIINDFDKKLSTLKNEKALKLKLSPTTFENQRPLCLLVKNYEKRKIVELEAKIRFVYKYFLNAKKEISKIGWRVNSENILEQSDVRPNDELSGIIANFSDDFSGIKFGKSREDYFINSNEAIYTIQLSYCGKIEGEIDFRYKNIDVDIFVNQSKKLFCSAGYASQLKIISEDFEEKFLGYRKKQKQAARKNIILGT